MAAMVSTVSVSAARQRDAGPGDAHAPGDQDDVMGQKHGHQHQTHVKQKGDEAQDRFAAVEMAHRDEPLDHSSDIFTGGEIPVGNFLVSRAILIHGQVDFWRISPRTMNRKVAANRGPRTKVKTASIGCSPRVR